VSETSEKLEEAVKTVQAPELAFQTSPDIDTATGLEGARVTPNALAERMEAERVELRRPNGSRGFRSCTSSLP
jgi:hypothetical protein